MDDDGRSPHGNLSSTYLLSRTNLTDEQKLQVALCRRQCWLRAFQAGPVAAICGYGACVLLEMQVRRPRGSRTVAPLCAGILGMVVGAYAGGREGKATLNMALRQPRRVG